MKSTSRQFNVYLCGYGLVSRHDLILKSVLAESTRRSLVVPGKTVRAVEERGFIPCVLLCKGRADNKGVNRQRERQIV